MKEAVSLAKEAAAKKRVSPTKSDNSIHRLRDEPERQLGSLRGVIANIRRDGGKPSVESIATELSGMRAGERAPVLLALQQTHGNLYVQRVVSGIQAKLKVGQPGDIYEQEADRVADEVMRMAEPQVQRQLEEEEKREEEMLSMKENEEGSTIIKYNDFGQNLQSSEPIRPSGPRIQMKKYVRQLPYEESVEAVKPENFEKLGTIVSMGTKGPSSTVPYKGEMEPAFGVDFSNVRIYTGSDPKEASESLGAEAFTVGNKIAFKEANPDKATVAHELTHVVQQGGTPSVQISSMTSKSDSSEKEASAVEDAFTSGKELPEISTQLSATTVAGVWGEGRQMREEEGVWVRYDPEHGQVEITGDHADLYLLINQPGLSSGIIPVSQLNAIVRADIEATLELPLSELPQTLEETAREAATSPPGSRRMAELPPRAEPAVRPGMPEHLRPGVELFREGLREQRRQGRQQSAARRQRAEIRERWEEAGLNQPIAPVRRSCPSLTRLQARIYVGVMEITNGMMPGSPVDPCRGIRATNEAEAIMEGVVEGAMPGVGGPVGELGPPGSVVSTVIDIIGGGARYNRASLCATSEGRIRAGIQDAIQMFARENQFDPVRVAQVFREAERVLDRRTECLQEQHESRESRR